MKHTLSLFLVLSSLMTLAFNPREDLKLIDVYLQKDLDSALLLTKELLLKSESHNDLFGIVKANLYLGYISKKQMNYGKSVVYNLEGIRYCTKGTYEGIGNDNIWLHRNLANTFRQFEANQLATKYNLAAIEIAETIGNQQQAIDIKFNQSLVYQKNQEFSSAIALMLEILPLIEKKDYRDEVINQVGLVYLEMNDYENAKNYFEQLINAENASSLFKAKAYHNLGEILYETGKIKESIEYLQKSIEIKLSIPDVDKYSIFNTYRNLGRYLFEDNDLVKAEEYLQKAELLAEHAAWDASSFEIYKTFSALFYKQGLNDLGSQYSERYFSKIQDYIQTQEEIQKKDKEYNFDLITKRYFDEVARQEQIASILFYSKLTSGSLLTLLLLVIAFNRYEKIRLRKSIERELISLKVLE